MTIEKLVAAIRLDLANNNNYAALVLSLVLPDICGKLEYPTFKSKKRFELWFDTYLKKYNEILIGNTNVVFMTSLDFYALRCSILHEASEDLANQQASDILDKVKFTTMSSHRNKIGKILQLNVKCFCEEICNEVENWLNDISTNEEVVERIKLLIKIEDSTFRPTHDTEFGDNYLRKL